MEEEGSDTGIVGVVVAKETEVVRNLGGEDPFMNDLILEKIFKHCTPGAINACRLVCKKWYSESLPAWTSGRGRRPIKILCYKKPAPGDEGWRLENDRTRLFMSDFVKDFHTSTTPQNAEINGMGRYKNFYLQFDDTSFPLKSDYPLWSAEAAPLNGFWNRNGNWITRLKVHYCGYLDSDFFRRLFWCEYTPQLEELDIDIWFYRGYVYEQLKSVVLVEERAKTIGLKSLKLGAGYQTYLLVPWEAYLGSCPNLENLDIMKTSNSERILNILTAIKNLRTKNKNKKLLCLKSLRMQILTNGPDKLSSAVIKLLKESQLDFESLSLNYKKDVPEHEIHDLSTMYSKTLKKLNFDHPAPLEASPFLGITMEHLASLVVQGDHPLKNLAFLFLRELPVLRSLELTLGYSVKSELFYGSDIPPAMNSMISSTKEEDMGGGGVTLLSLSHFYCEYPGGFEPEDLTRLHGWMPNLLRLELQLDSENFRAVCQLWPNLRHISIFGRGIGDRGIVGLDSTRNGQISFNEPNITNLQDLRSFRVRPSFRRRRDQEPPEGDHLKLSCHSVKHGLSKLRRLEKVTISKT